MAFNVEKSLTFGNTQSNNFLFGSLIFTNKSRIGCLDTVEHKLFFSVNYYILNEWL